MNRIIRISFITLPLTFFIIFIVDMFQGSLIGGSRVVFGFPLPYYIEHISDSSSTPVITLNQPVNQYLNIIIIYVICTITAFVITRNRRLPGE